MPEGLEKIDKYAFISCENLTDVNIPYSVTYIGELAFAECRLKDVVLPPNADFISKDAFEGCKLATKIDRKTSNPDFEIDGTTIRKYRGKDIDIVIPNGITSIFLIPTHPSNAFLPITLTPLGITIFSNLSHLQNAPFPIFSIPLSGIIEVLQPNTSV